MLDQKMMKEATDLEEYVLKRIGNLEDGLKALQEIYISCSFDDRTLDYFVLRVMEEFRNETICDIRRVLKKSKKSWPKEIATEIELLDYRTDMRFGVIHRLFEYEEHIPIKLRCPQGSRIYDSLEKAIKILKGIHVFTIKDAI